MTNVCATQCRRGIVRVQADMMFQPGRFFFGGLAVVAYVLHVLQMERYSNHLFVAGILYPPIFTLQEYVMHRFLLHGGPNQVSRSHDGHHKHNIELRRIFVPVPVTIFLAITTAVGSYLIDPDAMPSVAMSMIIAYLLFEFAHYAAHVPQQTQLLHSLRKHHLLHHSRPDTKYGFVSASWDVLLGTYGTIDVASAWLCIPYPVLPFVLSSAGIVEWVSMIVAALPVLVSADEDSYREYHQHPGNVVIHMICVPVLVWSVLASMAHVPVANGVTMAHVASITYTLFRITTLIDLLTMLWMFAMACRVSTHRISRRTIAVTHAMSWIVQIVIGHWMLEGSRPALFDSLVPSLLVAPIAITRDIVTACSFQ